MGGILLNLEGRRFVDELTTRDKCTQVGGRSLGRLGGVWNASNVPVHCMACACLQAPPRSSICCPTTAQHPAAPARPLPPQAIMEQQERQAFLVLGAAAAQQFGPALGFYLGKQLFVKHDSLAAAATAMGVPEATLVAEIDAYNTAAAAGKDDFGKTVFPTTIDRAGPLHVARITPVVHYTMVGSSEAGRWAGVGIVRGPGAARQHQCRDAALPPRLPCCAPAPLLPPLHHSSAIQTCSSCPLLSCPLQGGVAINTESQALGANGVPVPGLFAAGEVGVGATRVLWVPGHWPPVTRLLYLA